MFPLIEHPDIESALRTGYPRGQEDDVLNDEDDEDDESEFWGDEREDDIYEERRECGLW